MNIVHDEEIPVFSQTIISQMVVITVDLSLTVLPNSNTDFNLPISQKIIHNYLFLI